ncbi:hypothetical protein GQ42DRAFT_165446 [Ramicandelaber brevisporus]|nr:hypothetical protein GQ42DRAFT_165446 [Ramicandelaber brevisporus]
MSKHVPAARIVALLERVIAERPASATSSVQSSSIRWTLAEKLALARSVAANDHLPRGISFWERVRVHADTGLAYHRTALATMQQWHNLTQQYQSFLEFSDNSGKASFPVEAPQAIVYGSKHSKWTAEELSTLRKLMTEHEYGSEKRTNWGTIAMHIPGRSPLACQLKWIEWNNKDPQLSLHGHNQNSWSEAKQQQQKQQQQLSLVKPMRKLTSWSEAELNRLIALVDEYKKKNPDSLTIAWPEISQQLGNNRSAVQCRSKYQMYKTLNARRSAVASAATPTDISGRSDDPLFKRFTADDIQRLKTIVAAIQTKYNLPAAVSVSDLGDHWDEIHLKFGNTRSKMQLYKWWYDNANWSRNTRLTKEELELLKSAVSTQGRKWRLISQRYLPDVSPTQLYYEYRNAAQTPWTVEETERLMELVKEHGQDWTLISRHFTGKMSQKCRDQYFKSTKPR